LLLGVFQEQKKKKIQGKLLGSAHSQSGVCHNPNASIAQVQIEIRPHRQAPLGVATEDGGSVTDQAHSANRQLE
jgi:hypothetical protein